MSLFRNARAWALVRMFHAFPLQPGDIISLKAPNAQGVFWLASVGRSSREGTAVRVLAKGSTRPKKFQHSDLDHESEPIILTPVEFRASDPVLIRCGAAEGWTGESYVLAER